MLYVPDYVLPQIRINATIQLGKMLENCFPQYLISLAVSEGPFEDIVGTTSHFDGDALQGRTKTKQVATVRNDFQTSVVKLGRSAVYHSPKLIIGHGQGALIAFGFARPYVLELSLQTRNVQRAEAQKIGEAWGRVGAAVRHGG